MKRLLLIPLLAFAVGARDFDGSSDKLSVDVAPVTAPPYSNCTWFNSDVLSDDTIWFLGDKDVTDNNMTMRINSSGALRLRAESTAATVDITTSNTFTLNTWNFGCVIAASDSDWTVILNGDVANAGTSTSTSTIVGVDRMAYGMRDSSSPGKAFDGELGHGITYDVAIADDTTTTLFNGRLIYIQPDDRVSYLPMNGGGSTSIDITGLSSMTITGTMITEEPPTPHPIIAP